MKFKREILHNRHRLSHQQINSWLGEQQNQLVFEEKLYQLNHLSKFLEIADVFIKNDIWFLPLKGPMLSYRIYGDATCRVSRDFDILIKQEEVETTINLFRNLGFKYETGRWHENGIRNDHITSMVNQLTLYHPVSKIVLEIHWRVFIDPIIKFDIIEKVVSQNIRQFEFVGKKMNQFTIEFELLYLIIHGGLHTWRRLKWLVDVHEIANRFEINQSVFKQLTEQFGAHRMVGLCNALLRHFFPGTQILPVDYQVPEWFQRYAIWQAEREEDFPDTRLSNLFKLRWYYIQAFPSRMYKKKRIHILFSSIKKIGHSFPLLF
jgi:hypothetical protein